MSAACTFVSIHDATLMDALPVHVLSAHSRTVRHEWIPSWHTDPFWRLYHNFTDGVSIETINNQHVSLDPEHIVVIPAWHTFRGHAPIDFGHTWVTASTPGWSAVASRKLFNHVLVIQPDIIYID